MQHLEVVAEVYSWDAASLVVVLVVDLYLILVRF